MIALLFSILLLPSISCRLIKSELIEPANCTADFNQTIASTCSERNPCLRKCCPDEYAIAQVKRCKKNLDLIYVFAKDKFPENCTTDVNEPKYKYVCVQNKTITGKMIIASDEKMSAKSTGDNIRIVHGFCPGCAVFSGDLLFEEWYPNGTLRFIPRTFVGCPEFSYSHHCVDYFTNKNTMALIIKKGKPDNSVETSIYFRIIFGIHVVSMIFLVATFLAYFVLLKKKNLHEKTLMHYVTAQFMGSFLLLFRYINLDVNLIQGFGCKSMGFLLLYFLLAKYFWLNVMCFDLWSTFGRLNKMNLSALKMESKRLIRFCMYGWGCPAIIVLFTIFRESLLNNGKALINAYHCFFEDNGIDKKIHFTGVVIFLLLINIILFISTAISLENYVRTNIADSMTTKSKLKSDKRRFFLYIQLFIIVGCSCLFDFLIKTNEILAFISNSFSALQGVFIFLIFVCKKKTWLLLKERLGHTKLVPTKPKETENTLQTLNN